jgi:hypothetical protein
VNRRTKGIVALALGAGALAALGVVRGPAVAREVRRRIAWQRLRAFAGRDLTKLSEGEQALLGDLLGRLAPSVGRGQVSFGPSEAWLLAPITGDDAGRFVFFAGRGLIVIPGASEARMVVFDAHGSVVRDEAFAAGWRIEITGATVEAHEGRMVIAVGCDPDVHGRTLDRQIYGVLATGEPVLLRLEWGGKAGFNGYSTPNQTIGPWFPARSEEEWEAALASSDRFEVLRTLLVLGGRHCPADVTDYGNVSHEPAADARVIASVRARSGVRRAIEELARSSDPWTADAARLAMSPPKDYRPW